MCTFEHDHLPLDYWCNEDNVSICSRCRLSHHLRHDVISAQERNSRKLQDWKKATDGANQLLDRLNQAIKSLDGKHCAVEADYKKSYKEVLRQLKFLINNLKCNLKSFDFCFLFITLNF